jgi:hypothetical protein
MIILIIIFFFLFNLSYQKMPSRDNFDTCKEGGSTCTFSAVGDPFEILQNFKDRNDEIVKNFMFETLKDTISKMKLPNEFADKVKNEDFLKEAIDTVMKSQEAESKKKVKDAIKKEKEEVKDKDKYAHDTMQSSSNNQKYKYKPNNSHVNINDWHDLYHYFPQLSNNIRLWKLEFKESARQNWKKFKGCANPGRLIDWLVPDIEEVKKAKRKTKPKSRRERQRDF